MSIGITFNGNGQMIDERTGQPVRVPPEYKTVDLSEFMAYEFPEPEFIIDPWLPKGGICMLFARAGVGKTWVAADVALSAASGRPALDHWPVPTARKVLYIDGEMDGAEFRERIQRLMLSKGIGVDAKLRIMGLSLQGEGMPMIDDPLHQEGILSECVKADLIIVDNLSSLTRMPENEGESWLPVQEWALRMRAQGKAVLIIHHAGKGGDQRGTSRRIDVMNTVVQLRPAAGTDEETAFDWEYIKSRGFSGDATASRRIRLLDDPEGVLLSWDVVKLTELEQDDLIDYIRQGWAYGEIAEEMGVSKGTVSKRAQKAVSTGRLSVEELPKRGRPRAGNGHG